MKYRFVFLFSLILSLSAGCATGAGGASGSSRGTFMIPDRDGESTADGAAYAADSMHFSIPMPLHDPDTTPFYFKHCNENGGQSFYSKTQYDCAYP